MHDKIMEKHIFRYSRYFTKDTLKYKPDVLETFSLIEWIKPTTKNNNIIEFQEGLTTERSD